MEGISRSDFLKLGATASLPLIFNPQSPVLLAQGNSQPALGTRPLPLKTGADSAIVLGGGLSGLYSAYLLKSSGIKATVVEADSRWGGRIFTQTLPGRTENLEKGGEWIHSGHKDLRLVLQEFQLSLSQEELNLPTLSSEAREIVDSLVSMHTKMNPKQRESLDKISFAEYIRYQKIPDGDRKQLGLLLRRTYGEESRFLSCDRVLLDLNNSNTKEASNQKISEGSEALITALLEALSDENLILSDPVVSISQSKTRVTVTLQSGRKVSGAFCISTLPPQIATQIAWDPVLPREYRQAALQIQYSRIYKGYLLLNDPIQNTPSNPFYTGQLFDSIRILKDSGKKILSIETSGEKATILRQMKDEIAELYLKAGIKEVFPKENPNISFFSSSPWQFNPYFLGARSISLPGSIGAREALAQPFQRVFFAGEHTAEHPGTMNSAIQSAIQVQNQL